MKKLVITTLLITGVIALFFIIIGLIYPQSKSGLLVISIIGIGIGITSIFVEKRSKLWLYTSVMVIIVGGGVVSAYQGYLHPAHIDQWDMVNNFGSFYMVFLGYLFNNTFVAFMSLLGGPTIVYPYSQLSSNIAGLFPEFAASRVAFYGFKGVILILGWLNAYPELSALFLAVMAGIRVGLTSFVSFLNIGEEGFESSMRKIKDAMVHEIINTVPKVVILLIIAALLETLWIPFWISYWMQHIL